MRLQLNMAMDESRVIRDYLKDELRAFEDCLWASVESANPRIAEMVGYLFQSLGKQLRPILMFLTAKACGGIRPETYRGAVAVELLHNATLIHDDVIDESKLRRSRPSVNAVFDNTRSVLVGDYLLSSALKESAATNDMEIMRVMADLGRNLAEGELNQYSLATEIIVDEAAYFDVIEKKTASLMRACTVIGARTAGADDKTVALFKELGGLLGISFQIRDDIFDYFKGDIGKPTGNDIREGKITLPLIFALKNASQEESQAMMHIIRSRNYSEENIHILLEFAKKNGGIDYAYKIMDDYLQKAESVLQNLSIDKKISQLLQILLLYLRNREY